MKLIIFSYFTDEERKKEERARIQNVFLGFLPATITKEENDDLRERIFVYFHKRGYLFESQNDKQIFELKPGIELTMVRVEAGDFTMSADDGENEDNEKKHIATLTKDFYIGKTPVTQEQWEAVMGGNPSNFKGDKLPVEQVSWHDAMNFCEKLNEMVKVSAGYHFTLPTETQWEYAAKGGKKNNGCKYSGNDTLDEVGWYCENSGGKTHEVVGSEIKKANDLGLCDMSGNVWEWCLDDWTEDSREAKAEFTRGNDSSSSPRVCRGGSWLSSARFCRVANRNYNDPGYRYYYVGFRVVLSAVQ